MRLCGTSSLSIEAYDRDLQQFLDFIQRYGGTGLGLASKRGRSLIICGPGWQNNAHQVNQG